MFDKRVFLLTFHLIAEIMKPVNTTRVSVMPTREKALLSVQATHPIHSDITHVDIVVDYFEGQYRMVLQPKNKRDGLDSTIIVVGKNSVGTKIVLRRVSRYSSKTLENIYPSASNWHTIYDAVFAQGFILDDEAKEALQCEVELAEEARSQL